MDYASKYAKTLIQSELIYSDVISRSRSRSRDISRSYFTISILVLTSKVKVLVSTRDLGQSWYFIFRLNKMQSFIYTKYKQLVS